MPHPEGSSPYLTGRTHNTPATSGARPAPPRPGTLALRTALGIQGSAQLDRHRQQHTVIGQFASLVWATAREADSLHEQLLSQAGEIRDWVNRLATRPRPMFLPVPGVPEPLAHTLDVHAALLAQQLTQLDRALAAYKKALTTPRTISA